MTKTTLEMKLLFRGLCTNTVTLYFNLMLLLMISKTTPDRGEITRRYYSTEKKRKSYIKKTARKNILDLKNLSCSMLM